MVSHMGKAKVIMTLGQKDLLGFVAQGKDFVF